MNPLFNAVMANNLNYLNTRRKQLDNVLFHLHNCLPSPCLCDNIYVLRFTRQYKHCVSDKELHYAFNK